MQLKTKYPYNFLVCKGLSFDDVGVSRDTAFQEIRPGGSCFFKINGDFVEEKLGWGYRGMTLLGDKLTQS